jgi:hypothetical protein
MVHEVFLEVLVDEMGSSITYHGVPNLENIVSSNILIELLWSADLHGRASTHLET